MSQNNVGPDRSLIAEALTNGAEVFEMWQAAPVGSDTELGQAYWVIKKPRELEEAS